MKKLIYITITLSLLACGSDDGQETIINVPVNISINLLNPDFNDLNIDGGFVYITGGVRGIMIYRESSGSYLAFERNCTFQPSNSCARILMDDSRLFMVDTCCASQFSLEGNVLSGVAPFPLRQYATNLNTTILNINN